MMMIPKGDRIIAGGNGGNRRGGFTLIEVLAAFLIFTLSVTVVYRALSTGVIGSRRSSETISVMLQAQSIAAELGRSIPLPPSPLEQILEIDGQSWTLRTVSVADLFGRSASGQPLHLHEIELIAPNSSGPAQVFRTYRLSHATENTNPVDE